MTIAFVTTIAIAAASSAAPLLVPSVIERGLGFVREPAPLQAGQGETRSAAVARLASALPVVVAVSTTDGVPRGPDPLLPEPLPYGEKWSGGQYNAVQLEYRVPRLTE